MYDSIRAFAKTAQDVGEKEDEALGSELERHLLRTLCLDLVGVMVKLLVRCNKRVTNRGQVGGAHAL